MKFTARIKDIGRTLSGSLTITLEIQQMGADEATAFLNMDKLDVEIKKHSKKRSKEANRYYWELSSRLAEALHVSKPYIHNYLLRKYGQLEIISGQAIYAVLPDTDEAMKKADEDQMVHLRPTSEVKIGKDGTMFRTYMMIKGSHEYNTKEMSELIDGLISECKEMGIETIPLAELERMMKDYEKHHAKR